LTPPPTGDAFLAAWFPIGVALAASTLESFRPGPLALLVFLVSVSLILGWAVTGIFQLCSAAWRRQWRLAAKRLAHLAIGATFALVAFRSGDYLHLAVLYPSYRATISQTAQRPVMFPWGDDAVTVLDGMRLRTLVYDESGKTTENARIRDGFCTIDRRLVGNFFIEQDISLQNIRLCASS